MRSISAHSRLPAWSSPCPAAALSKARWWRPTSLDSYLGSRFRYHSVRALPVSEPNPPFLLVVDVGHGFEVLADFSQAGKAYLPFPDPRTFRIRLEHLVEEKVRERLRLIWTHPSALDPALQSADVTREISAHLAELALAPLFDANAGLEEHWLRQRFPEYAGYEQRVRRLVPRIY